MMLLVAHGQLPGMLIYAGIYWGLLKFDFNGCLGVEYERGQTRQQPLVCTGHSDNLGSDQITMH